MQNLTTERLLDLSHTIAAPLFAACTYPWEALAGTGDFVRAMGPTLDPDRYDHPSENVWIAKTASVAPSASITGPVIICDDAEIRQCAYIRGNAVIGAGAVVGNSCEVKNAVIFDSVQVPHFNYVGDSVLGFRSHMGAGAVTSNIKSDRTNVTIRNGDSIIETGLRKMGAILGDGVEVGCNSVLNPGTVVGRGSRVYPLSNVRGVVPEGCIFKSAGRVVPIE